MKSPGWFVAAVGSGLLVVSASFAMPRDVEPEDWRAAIATATSEGGSAEGASVPWKGPWGGGDITYGPISGEGTDRPCRRFSMTYGQVNFNARYSGQICASTAAMARWSLAGEPQETSMQRRTARVETPDEPRPRQDQNVGGRPTVEAQGSADRPSSAGAQQLATELLQRLSRLGYSLDPGLPLDQGSNRAVVLEFAADHRLSGALSFEMVLDAARASEASSFAAWRSGCGAPAAPQARACGRVSP